MTDINIRDNQQKIEDFIREAILQPRITLLKWSKITGQTPNLKIGYPGQHLASLIVGMQGTGTAARGNDIVDKSEVKSCSRIDQLDECSTCGASVMRQHIACPKCGSSEIKRRNDSKWLITIHSEDELNMYLNEIPRIIFIIADYPNFNISDFDTVRFSAYEIWPQSARAYNFREILKEYYYEIYLKHIEINPEKTPAPKNFWPDSFQFYMCNPIKIFSCNISNFNSTEPEFAIDFYIPPDADRSTLPSEDMPVRLLNRDERRILKLRGIDVKELAYLDENMKAMIHLRNSKPITQKKKHKRK